MQADVLAGVLQQDAVTGAAHVGAAGAGHWRDAAQAAWTTFLWGYGHRWVGERAAWSSMLAGDGGKGWFGAGRDQGLLALAAAHSDVGTGVRRRREREIKATPQPPWVCTPSTPQGRRWRAACAACRTRAQSWGWSMSTLRTLRACAPGGLLPGSDVGLHGGPMW